jgi:hypothetical protein
MSSEILKKHVEAIDRALRKMRRLERESGGITTLLEKEDNDRQYYKWRKELEFNRDMIVVKSNWKEFYRSFAQSPLSIAKSVGIGAFCGAVVSTFVLFVPYFITRSSMAVDEPIQPNDLRLIFVSCAFATCVGAVAGAVYEGRSIHIDRVCNQVHDMMDLEAQNLRPYADRFAREAGTRSRTLTVISDTGGLGNSQPSRAFY